MTFDLSWLDTIPVSSIALKRRGGQKGVVVLNSTVPVVEALNILVHEEILSAPVWDDGLKDFAGTLVRLQFLLLFLFSFLLFLGS